MKINKNNLAPLILFVYDRYYCTKKTLDALQKNYLSKNTNLIIYSDFHKKNNKKKVDQVRNLITKYKKFKSIKIIYRKKNLGLAASIRSGITQTFKIYDKAIFLEDDIITSKYFLNYMNYCLEKYKDKKKVFHITSWNYPVPSIGLNLINFSTVMNCWGWATWRDRWQRVSFDTNRIYKTFTKKEISKLNLNGSENFWHTFLLNRQKKISTWAIFWAITIIKNNGLCIFPKKKYTQNIGMDGTGTNNKNKLLLNPYSIFFGFGKNTIKNFPKDIKESKLLKLYIISFYFFANNKVLTLINLIYTKLDVFLNRIFYLEYKHLKNKKK
jgi:hypothetical protein